MLDVVLTKVGCPPVGMLGVKDGEPRGSRGKHHTSPGIKGELLDKVRDAGLQV
jgi:hypothetical protein